MINNLVNLTPHNIEFNNPKGEPFILKPSGIVPRVTSNREVIGNIEINGITFPIYNNKYGKVDNMPREKEGTMYVVQPQIANALPDRQDILILDHRNKNKNGNLEPARAFVFC